METFMRVTYPLSGESTNHQWIPLTKPVTESFDVFFDLRLNKELCKQSWDWWFRDIITLIYDVIVMQ